MLIKPYSWRLFFYVILAFALALLIIAFLFVEETSYDRKAHILSQASSSSPRVSEAEVEGKPTELTRERVVPVIPQRTPFIKTLSPLGRYDPSIPFFTTMARSFTYFLVPQVFWVVTSFGIYIGLGAFAFNYTFPIKITAPPYNWSEVSQFLTRII
jgi:hypothetical protein